MSPGTYIVICGPTNGQYRPRLRPLIYRIPYGNLMKISSDEHRYKWIINYFPPSGNVQEGVVNFAYCHFEYGVEYNWSFHKHSIPANVNILYLFILNETLYVSVIREWETGHGPSK